MMMKNEMGKSIYYIHKSCKAVEKQKIYLSALARDCFTQSRKEFINSDFDFDNSILTPLPEMIANIKKDHPEESTTILIQLLHLNRNVQISKAIKLNIIHLLPSIPANIWHNYKNTAVLVDEIKVLIYFN